MDKSWKWVVLKAEKESGEDLQVAAGKRKGEQTQFRIVSNCIGVKLPVAISTASVTHSIR